MDDQLLSADNFNYNGSLYVPLRAVSENMGMEALWDQPTKSAYIYNNNNHQAILRAACKAYISNGISFCGLQTNSALDVIFPAIMVGAESGTSAISSNLETVKSALKMLSDESYAGILNPKIVDQTYIDDYNNMIKWIVKTQVLLEDILKKGVDDTQYQDFWLDVSYDYRASIMDIVYDSQLASKSAYLDIVNNVIK